MKRTQLIVVTIAVVGFGLLNACSSGQSPTGPSSFSFDTMPSDPLGNQSWDYPTVVPGLIETGK